ncbi:uncharacterized protein LOC116926689 isoform X1 [Daphnia magna]|nr:uncharacterized protein LOC116926689 isoform X1 [Daphnia magna]KAK4027110.1 hypothetical protein OUZ56_016126 [Daphnia magna]
MSSPISDIPLLLFFIYDVEKSISESDDPLESILYFHPNSEPGNIERRISVVGQIVGTALCVKQLLSVPKLITLERGKFALSWSGRFILVVGSPQSVSTHIIHNQRDFIHRLLGGKFGELSEFFEASKAGTYEGFRVQIQHFCDSQLATISKKWAELASQPTL